MITVLILKYGPYADSEYRQDNADDQSNNELKHGITSKRKSRQEHPDGPLVKLNLLS